MFVCVCTSFVPGAFIGQRVALDFFRLKLEMVVSYHVGTGN